MLFRKLSIFFLVTSVAFSAYASDNKHGKVVELKNAVTVSGKNVASFSELSGKYTLVETSSSDSTSFKKDREQYFMDVYNHYKSSGFEWVTMYNAGTSSLCLVNSAGVVCAEEEDLRNEGLEKALRMLIPEAPAYKTVDVEAFDKLVADRKDVQIVDVRTQEEYDEGSVPGSVLIDMKKEDFGQKAAESLDKSKPVAVFCKGGVRSRKAAWKLVDMGYNVINLDKGFDSWKKYKASSVILAARMEIKQDSIEAFKKIAEPLIAATRKEPGCLRYELYQDSGNPCLFFFFEEYRDDEANSFHAKQEYLKVFKAKREPMLKVSPKAVVYKVGK